MLASCQFLSAPYIIIRILYCIMFSIYNERLWHSDVHTCIMLHLHLNFDASYCRNMVHMLSSGYCQCYCAACRQRTDLAPTVSCAVVNFVVTHLTECLMFTVLMAVLLRSKYICYTTNPQQMETCGVWTEVCCLHWRPSNEIQHKYEGRSLNKLQNGTIPLVLRIDKIRNISFVGNIILNIHINFLMMT